MNILRRSIFIFLCFFAVNLFAQTPKEIETHLLNSFTKIGYWYMQKSDDTTGIAIDSLYSVNDEFSESLGEYALKYPFTIQLPFDQLVDAGLDILTSDDGRLRIYSWDAGTGGGQPAISNIFQFKTGKRTDTLLNVPADPYGSPADFNKIYHFTINGKTYYSITYRNIVGINDQYQGIMIFAMEHGKLKSDIKLIKTKNGLQGYLSCYFHASADDPADSISVINFDSQTKTIILPLIDDNSQLTGKSVIYKFTGRYFEEITD